MFSSSHTTGAPVCFHQHLGYALRESWISKALLTLLEAERRKADQQGAPAQVFAFPQATDRLGIGPTMVRALRFWLRATGLMVEQRGQGVRPVPALTPLGRLLAQHDPSLTRSGSLWLLHAHLARTMGEAPAFAWFFQHFVQVNQPFTKEECVTRLHTWAITQATTPSIRPRAIVSDVECLLRMYLPAPALSAEEAVANSPFRRLGLLSEQSTPAGQPPAYVFHGGQPPALVVLATLLWLEPERKPLSVRDLVSRPGSVGRTFGLSSEVLINLLASIPVLVPAWAPALQRGLLEWITPPSAVSPEEVIAHYYRLSER